MFVTEILRDLIGSGISKYADERLKLSSDHFFKHFDIFKNKLDYLDMKSSEILKGLERK